MPKNPNLEICLVDDDIMCLNLYRQLLQQLGYSNIELFDNGQDCLDSLEKLAPDVEFSRIITWRASTGCEVLKKIKAFNKVIIVLFISGHEDVETAMCNTMKQGAVDYLLKGIAGPGKNEEVMERVEELVPAAHPDQQEKEIHFFQKLFS